MKMLKNDKIDKVGNGYIAMVGKGDDEDTVVRLINLIKILCLIRLIKLILLISISKLLAPAVSPRWSPPP